MERDSSRRQQSPTACIVEEQSTQDNRCVARTRDASEAADIAVYPRTESKAGRTLVPHKPIRSGQYVGRWEKVSEKGRDLPNVEMEWRGINRCCANGGGARTRKNVSTAR